MIAIGNCTMLAALLLVALVAFLGCQFSCPACLNSLGPQEEFERTVELSAPMAPGQELSAKTHNGYIAVSGAEAGECKAVVTIRARAGTQKRAKELAEATKASLESGNGKLVLKVDKPKLDTAWGRESICCDFQAAVPVRTPLELESHNGKITVERMEADVQATTHNGRLAARNVRGELCLKSYNGAIDVEQASGKLHGTSHNGHIHCREVAGGIHLESYNGKVEVTCAKDSPKACDIAIKSHNGAIDLALPVDASASARLAAHNGRIHTDLPMNIVGEIGKQSVKGTIGEGKGRLELESYNGSVRIRQAG